MRRTREEEGRETSISLVSSVPIQVNEDIQKSIVFFRDLMTPDLLEFFRKIWCNVLDGEWKIEEHNLCMSEWEKNNDSEESEEETAKSEVRN